MRASVKALSIGALAATSLFIAPAAIAADATVNVAGGQLTPSVTNATLTGATTSSAGSTAGGTYNVSVTDERGTGAGWSVSQSVTDFAHATDATATIAATNLTVASFGDVAASTDSVDPATSVVAQGVGTLGPVANAAAGGGEGSYTIPVTVSLDVPAFAKSGVYSATLSTTTAPAIV